MPGYCLVTVWLLSGYCFVTAWLFPCYFLFTTWLLLGFYLVTVCLLRGYCRLLRGYCLDYVVTVRLLPGHFLLLHGYRLVTVRLLPDYCLVTFCLLPGFCPVTTCRLSRWISADPDTAHDIYGLPLPDRLTPQQNELRHFLSPLTIQPVSYGTTSTACAAYSIDIGLSPVQKEIRVIL